MFWMAHQRHGCYWRTILYRWSCLLKQSVVCRQGFLVEVRILLRVLCMAHSFAWGHSQGPIFQACFSPTSSKNTLQSRHHRQLCGGKLAARKRLARVLNEVVSPMADNLTKNYSIISRVYHNCYAGVVFSCWTKHDGRRSISIFSTASAYVTSDLRSFPWMDKVDHHQRSISSMYYLSLAASKWLSDHIEQSPPWIFGCRVLTRPSIISGKPVTSSIAWSLPPALSGSLLIPPCRDDLPNRVLFLGQIQQCLLCLRPWLRRV